MHRHGSGVELSLGRGDVISKKCIGHVRMDTARTRRDVLGSSSSTSSTSSTTSTTCTPPPPSLSGASTDRLQPGVHCEHSEDDKGRQGEGDHARAEPEGRGQKETTGEFVPDLSDFSDLLGRRQPSKTTIQKTLKNR